eukprot:403286-Pleurochrysis_carterae.AAC.1
MALHFARLRSSENIANGVERAVQIACGGLQPELHIQQRAYVFTQPASNGGQLVGYEIVTEPRVQWQRAIEASERVVQFVELSHRRLRQAFQ